MAEEDLRVLFAEDRERGWRAFIDRYTPTLLRLIERAGVIDREPTSTQDRVKAAGFG